MTGKSIVELNIRAYYDISIIAIIISINVTTKDVCKDA